MYRLLIVSALFAGMPGSAQERDYGMTAEIGPLGAEPMVSEGGDYSLVGGLRPLRRVVPDESVFSDSFEPTSIASQRIP